MSINHRAASAAADGSDGGVAAEGSARLSLEIELWRRLIELAKQVA
jgi:hypothetical protein